MTFNQLRKVITTSILNVENESMCLRRFVRALKLPPHHKVLDVGCGYGNNLVLLREIGLEVLGVEVNPAIVAKNRETGLTCVTVDEYNAIEGKYDLILMSHVIEHFQPHDLITFMDSYLDRLNIGGYFIIVTPLFSSYFFEDFDHVKPYHPTGINMVFCSEDAQVQFYSRNRLKLIDIWFRKGPFKIIFMRDVYKPKFLHFSIVLNIVFTFLFKLSFGLIGSVDGWIGVYRKLE